MWLRIKGWADSRLGRAFRCERQLSGGEFDARELCPGGKRRLCAVDRQSSSKGMRRPSGGIDGGPVTTELYGKRLERGKRTSSLGRSQPKTFSRRLANNNDNSGTTPNLEHGASNRLEIQIVGIQLCKTVKMHWSDEWRSGSAQNNQCVYRPIEL